MQNLKMITEEIKVRYWISKQGFFFKCDKFLFQLQVYSERKTSIIEMRLKVDCLW